MILGMNLGFGERVGRPTLKRVRRWGCQAVRTDAWLRGPHGQPPIEVPTGLLKDYVADAEGLDLSILWLVSRPLRTGRPDLEAFGRRLEWIASRLPCPLGINIGWEGDDTKEPWAPREMAEIARLARQAVPLEADGRPTRRIDLWLNCSKNTTRAALDYMRGVLEAGVDESVGLDLHPYQTTNLFGLPNGAGFTSQAEMWSEWRALGRRLIVAECGATAARQTTGGAVILGRRIGGRVVQYTDGQIAEYTSVDLQRHVDEGVEQSHRFQLRDGPKGHAGHYEDLHGFIDSDDRDKLCVTSLAPFGAPAPAAAYDPD